MKNEGNNYKMRLRGKGKTLLKPENYFILKFKSNFGYQLKIKVVHGHVGEMLQMQFEKLFGTLAHQIQGVKCTILAL